MTSSFCINCGTDRKTNTIESSKKGDFTVDCTDCGILFRYYVIQKPIKTIEEADESFNKTALTDRQETGRANTGKSKRKRKRKKY